MIGGDGADTFVLTLTGAGNVVTLPDYALLGGPDGTLAYGDTIDLSALLDANFTANSNVSDFVRLVDFNGDLKLQVDTDGPGMAAQGEPGRTSPSCPARTTCSWTIPLKSSSTALTSR